VSAPTTRKLAQLFACLLLVSVPAVGVPGAALGAKGPKPSAGDNQYVDPLTNTTSNAATPPKTTATQTTTTPSSTLSQTPPVATTPATTTTQAKSLPFTGLNLGTLALIGVGLLASGLLLRLIARRASAP
jgi:uncharacterized surface anchored protein